MTPKKRRNHVTHRKPEPEPISTTRPLPYDPNGALSPERAARFDEICRKFGFAGLGRVNHSETPLFDWRIEFETA